MPIVSEADRATYCAGIYAELLLGSLIAVARRPDQRQKPRPLSPSEAQAAIADDGWRHQPGDIGIGYFATRPGLAEAETIQDCWVEDGWLRRIASAFVDYDDGMIGGSVPVCADHARQEDWPKGAERWVRRSLRALMDEFERDDELEGGLPPLPN